MGSKTYPHIQIVRILKLGLAPVILLLLLIAFFYLIRQELQSPLQIAEVNPGIASPLNGTFIVLDQMNLQAVEQQMHEANTLKMDTIIITYLSKKQKSATQCAGKQFVWANGYQEKLTTVMRLAQEYHIQVYFGLTWSHPDCPGGEPVSPNKEIILSYLTDYNSSQNPISYVLNNYGSHPNFSGWYIPDEPALAAWTDESQLPGLYDYWARYANAIKAKSNKPIIVAPYLVGVDHYQNNQNNIRINPTDVANRARTFQQQTGIHIQAWQDSVNVSGIALYQNNTNNRFTTQQYFEAISQKIGRNNFWVDVELGNCCTQHSGVRGGAYESTYIARLTKQLENANSQIASKRVSWINQTQMSAANPYRRHGSDRLYAGYLAKYVADSPYELLRPTQYSWITPPHPNYPDSGNEMFDGIVGENKIFRADPRVFFDIAYTGILGNAILTIDLGTPRLLAYLGVHALNLNDPAIYFPRSLKIECSPDNSSWTTAALYPTPTERIDSEFILGTPNGERLNASCRYLRLTLENLGWNMVSEIELISYKNNDASSAPPPFPALGFTSNDPFTRSLAAQRLLTAKFGSNYSPPTPTSQRFADVGLHHPQYAWIDAFAGLGITSGCGDSNYCPEQTVNRGAMAVFLLRLKHGSSYSPPAATGTVFSDVPKTHQFAAWIEQLKHENLTAGCGGGQYCPEDNVTHATAEIFLTTLAGQYPTPSPTTKPGDLNGDGKVDLFDFNLLVSKFGNPYTIFDYNNLVGNFGK